jgi:hypothetical protein
MFSFRRDKTGFFVTLILLAIVAGTFISTLVLIIVGLAQQGDWKTHLVSVKWVLGSAWVACIITVLVRLKIYQYQHILPRRQPDEQPPADAAVDATNEANKPSPS